MYPIQAEFHPLLAPVVAALRAAGLIVESHRVVRAVWGAAPRGTIRAVNLVGAGARYTDGTRAEVAQGEVWLVLGTDAEKSRTGLSSRDLDGGLVWQTDTTHRTIGVIVRAPVGWTLDQLRPALHSAGIAS
jgi:hypothetical protein